MKKLIKALPVSSLLLTVNLLLPASALAVCPVCTVAVAGGLGLSRYLGIDDAVSGIWAGGLVISVSFWFADWLKKKNYKFLRAIKDKYLIYLSVLFWVALTYIPLWKLGIIGHPFNTIWGIDKLIFGSVVGAITFLLAVFTDNKVRKIKGKQLFNYQKLVFPLVSLAFSSLIFYFVTG